MWELSWKPAAINLLDTLTRRPEPYHQQLSEQETSPKPPEKGAVSIHHQQRVKEEGLLERLCYDPYPRVGLIEHFLSPEVGLENFINGKYQEPGDFLMQPFTAEFVSLPADQPVGMAGAGQRGMRVIFGEPAGPTGKGAGPGKIDPAWGKMR